MPVGVGRSRLVDPGCGVGCMVEMGFSIGVAAAAVLLTTTVVATLLPGVTAAGRVAVTFLSLSGALSGYSAWCWVRWVKERTERLHWSVTAAFGAATTASELYAAAGIAVTHSGFLERLSALAGFGLVAALTVAVTGVVSLIGYQRSVTDQQLVGWAQRRRAWLTSGALTRTA